MTIVMALIPGPIIMSAKIPGVMRMVARTVVLVTMGKILVEMLLISRVEATRPLLILTWMNSLVLLLFPNTSVTSRSSRHSETPL